MTAAAWITLAGVCASAATGWLSYRLARRKNRVDAQLALAKADDEASDRLVALIQQEADKKVALVKLEFEAAMAKQEAEHLKQMNAMRDSMERQMADLRSELEEYRCYNAPLCKRRRKKSTDPEVSGKD